MAKRPTMKELRARIDELEGLLSTEQRRVASLEEQLQEAGERAVRTLRQRHGAPAGPTTTTRPARPKPPPKIRTHPGPRIRLKHPDGHVEEQGAKPDLSGFAAEE